MFDWLPILGSIILVDLILSGDNALVIGTVAASIPANLRWIAFLAGGGGAIILRILLTYSVSLLLTIPYIETAGGVILLIITIRLLIEWSTTKKVSEHEETKKKGIGDHIQKNNFFGAILTILLADATMSLDNVIAIAALAKHQTVLLIIGLMISIALILAGSALVAFLTRKLPWLTLIAAIILTFTAANIIASDKDAWHLLPNEAPWWGTAVYIGTFAVTILISGYFWLRSHNFFRAQL
jgi:YjbE family integral membrane protein